MDLPARPRTRLSQPSTADLVRHAEALVADSKATVARTWQVLDKCWQRLHSGCWAYAERPPVGPEDAGAHQGDGERAVQD
jgi:hypothetical protein